MPNIMSTIVEGGDDHNESEHLLPQIVVNMTVETQTMISSYDGAERENFAVDEEGDVTDTTSDIDAVAVLNDKTEQGTEEKIISVEERSNISYRISEHQLFDVEKYIV